MKIFRKSLCIFMALFFVFSSIPFAFAEGSTEASGVSLEVTVKTNKEKYSLFSAARLTVTVTNKGNAPVNNISAQVLFDQLTPVKEKKSTTEKHINCLNPGDSFDFSYRVILNGDSFDSGFFDRCILFFSGLFNSAYQVEAKDNSGSGINISKHKTTVTFGKYTAENVVELAYNAASSALTDTEAETTTEAATAATSEAVTAGTQIHTTESTTNATTTKAIYPESTTEYTTTKKYKPTETNSVESRAYSAYISFLEENKGEIDKIDVAYLNNDGLLELIIQNYNDHVVVYAYSDQYGMYTLYDAGKGKGYNMDVYYSAEENLIIAPAADTGGATYTTVEFSSSGATVVSELRRNNGKFEQACYLDEEKITLAECENIIASYPDKYFVVEGTVNQAINTLKSNM